MVDERRARLTRPHPGWMRRLARNQGLTLVHFPLRRENLLRDTLGGFSGLQCRERLRLS